jgi:NSS family neurotransmitter:Na+ symporter
MEQGRGHWGSRAGFILAAAGSAIGLGNLWKFPYITWHNNGGAFVLVYLVCILGVGLPIMMTEVLVGRRSQTGAVGAMRSAAGPRWAWVGGLGVLTGFVLLGYYTVVAGWTFRYILKTLQWSTGGYVAGTSSGAAFGEFLATGSVQVLLAGLFMVMTISVNYAGVGRGIERAARILMPILLGILGVLLVTALTMKGSGEALRFIFAPNFADLPARGVLEALGHSFFTLSLGMGAMITYGSYMSRKDSVVKASVSIVVLDTVIAIVATVIMFSVIFSQPGMRESLSGSTAGMLFITLPDLFYTAVPFGNVLAPMFYILVAFAALTSTISMLEVIIAYFIDEHGWSRQKASITCGAACFLLTGLCALSLGAYGRLSAFEVFAGKQGLFANLDHMVSNWMLPVGGFFITMAAGWIMTREATEKELVDDTTPSFFHYGLWRVFIRFVAPGAVAAIIIAVLRGADFS